MFIGISMRQLVKQTLSAHSSANSKVIFSIF